MLANEYQFAEQKQSAMLDIKIKPKQDCNQSREYDKANQ
jgi:hypothetical protein